MAVSENELTTLAQTHDIIALGIRADEVRRQLHGGRTTFVRVAMVSADPAAPIECPRSAGELRIAGIPATRSAAVERVRAAPAAAAGIPVTGFSLADLEALSG